MEGPLIGFFDNASRALVRLRVRGTADWCYMTAEIDTGAQPAITTSSAWVDAIAAEMEPRRIATLADGTKVPATAIVCEVECFGGILVIEGIAFAPSSAVAFAPPGSRQGPHALLGRSLLSGCRLDLDYGRRTVAIQRSEGLPA